MPNSYDEIMDAIIEYVQITNPKAVGCSCRSAVYGINADFRKWTKADLTNLATGNMYSAQYFGDILLIAKSSALLNKDGTDFTDAAKQAQVALTRIKPDNLSFEQFYTLIGEVAKETKLRRAELKKEYSENAELEKTMGVFADDAMDFQKYAQSTQPDKKLNDWTKGDYLHMLQSMDGGPRIDSLLVLARVASGEMTLPDKLGTPEQAQAALNAIKPASCADWKAYYILLQTVKSEYAKTLEQLNKQQRPENAATDRNDINEKTMGLFVKDITNLQQYAHKAQPDKKLSDWTKADYMHMLQSGNDNKQLFYNIFIIGGIASGDLTFESKLTTPEQAQAALTVIKPASCADWKAYYTLLQTVKSEYAKTLEQLNKQEQKPQNAEPDSAPSQSPSYHKLNQTMPDGSKPTGMIIPERDLSEQAALALLNAHQVIPDATHELKKPLETLVLETMKGLKSSVSLAA